MFTTIVVPMDDSPLAAKALPYAIRLAQKLGAHLTLLRAIEPGPLIDSTQETEEAARSAAHNQLALVQSAVTNPEYALHLPSDAVTCRVEYGERITALLRGIADEAADIVVMTTHGRAGIPLLALGSIASHVLRHVGVPVLLIRPQSGTTDQPIATLLSEQPSFSHERPILVPLDGTRQAETILTPAIALAKMINAPITLIEVVPPLGSPIFMGAYTTLYDTETEEGQEVEANIYLRKVQAQVVARGVPCSHRVVRGDVVEQISAYAHTIQAQYIALMTRKHGLFSHFVLGSTTDGLVRHSNMPVLALYPAAPNAAPKVDTATTEATI